MNREKAKQVSRVLKALVQKDPRFNINEVRIIVALERAIARLLQDSDISSHLIFKGGFVLLKNYESLRLTRDADALAIDISKEKLRDLVRTALNHDLDDGLWFGDVQVRELDEQGEYGAYRFDCAFQIGEPDLKKLHHFSRIHIDIGFSDRPSIGSGNQVMISVLGYEEPIAWKIYPIEYIVAEKLQTFFDRGSANSRAKDIYDLIHLLPCCHDKALLISAIKKTFENRETALPSLFVAQADQFDKTILRTAWPGMKVLDGKVEFDEAWEALMSCLNDLDKYFKMTR